MRPRAFVHNQKRSDCPKSSCQSEKETKERGDQEISKSSDLDMDSLDLAFWIVWIWLAGDLKSSDLRSK